MKRFLIILFCVVMLCCGCKDNTIYHWEFEKDASCVTKIEIVEAEDAYTYTVLKELGLDVIEQLYSDIENLEMTKYGGSLKYPRKKCFVITFENGEYDIISAIESKHMRYDEDGRFVGRNSRFICNAEQFDALIEKYMVV
ncbi:MAG: hypothetical protein J6L87_03070 [Clostridia bacterium]|nr:hypothetical protein [Clostridia bacterium]